MPEPGKGQAFNRYAYVYNNPVKYIDPTGHLPMDLVARALGFDSKEELWDSDLWKSWDNDWKEMLDQAQIGDLLIGVVGQGQFVLRLMFVLSYEGKIALWNVDTRSTFPDLRRFYDLTEGKWAVKRRNSEHSYVYEGQEIIKGPRWNEVAKRGDIIARAQELRRDWWKGADGEQIVINDIGIDSALTVYGFASGLIGALFAGAPGAFLGELVGLGLWVALDAPRIPVLYTRSWWENYRKELMNTTPGP